jgi:simple sugar transport system permease protein
VSKIAAHLPQIAVAAFLVGLVGITILATSISIPGLTGTLLVRFFMNGVLVLSLVPMLNAGVGINYGLPIGILAGLIGMCMAVALRVTGIPGLALAVIMSVFFSVPMGYGYARVLNRTRGQEEITGLFLGFAAVFVMSFVWAVAPLKNPEMLWPIGGEGLRPTIGLDSTFGHALNNLGLFNLGTVGIPTGGLLLFGVLCFGAAYFAGTKGGWAMSVVGENETFAVVSGIDVECERTLAVIASTVLAAVGICIYAQSYGFLELYDAPLMMAFPAASAILLGGFSGKNATVGQVILGTMLFQGVYVFSSPLANALVIPEMSEIVRVIITNGIILYALLFQGRRTAAV